MIEIRKILFLLFLSTAPLLSVHAQTNNPIIHGLSAHEISECSTPSSIAYNYVMAILMEDYHKAASFMEASDAYRFIRDLKEYGTEICDEYYFNELGLSHWKQALAYGYALITTDINDDCWAAKTDYGWMIHPNQIVKNGMVYIPGEDKPYVGIYSKNIYVACCPISEVNYARFNDVKWYNNMLLQISVKFDNNQWVIENGNMVNILEESEPMILEEAVEPYEHERL